MLMWLLRLEGRTPRISACTALKTFHPKPFFLAVLKFTQLLWTQIIVFILLFNFLSVSMTTNQLLKKGATMEFPLEEVARAIKKNCQTIYCSISHLRTESIAYTIFVYYKIVSVTMVVNWRISLKITYDW